jgi:hypothetical protein
MGNYKNIEHDFIERTMNIIAQYEHVLHNYPFEEQYNYTLLLNCLLGIIVLPKEKLYSHIPNHRITKELLHDMGLNESYVSEDIKRLRDLIHRLRNAITHYNFEVISKSEDFLIDRIVFHKSEDEGGEEIANFKSTELLPFVRYYADWVRTNIIEHK